MKIEEAIAHFHASLSYSQLSSHTIRAYKSDLMQWQQIVNKEDLEDLDFLDFQRYLLSLQSLSLQVTSLRRKRVVVHRFLKFCYQKRLCSNPLYEWVDPIRAKKNNLPKEILTSEEINILQTYLLKEIKLHKEKSTTEYSNYLYYCSIRNKLLVHILLYTGCRAQEVVALEKRNIDLELQQATILAKGQKYNTIPLHPILQQAFIEYYSDIESLSSVSLIAHLADSKYIFPSNINKEEHIATRTLQDIMKKFSLLLNRNIHAHLFRHTFASYCIASNMDIATVSSLVSHSNPAITLSIYTHEIASSQKKREMEKLNFSLEKA